LGRPVTRFDQHSQDHAQNWEASYRRLREESPIAWSNAHGGYWILSRYEDVATAVRDYATFASGRFAGNDGALAGGIAIPSLPFRLIPTETDPPDWERMRRLLNPVLGPTTVQRFRRSAQENTGRLIDNHVETGRMDLVKDLANPLPTMITLELLGLPASEWRRFAEPFNLFPSSPPGSQNRARAEHGMAWIYEQIQQATVDRRIDPRDDLISRAANANSGEDALTEDEIIDLLFNVLGAGLDTSTSLSSNAFWHLHRHHGDRDRLIDDPTLLREATEEFLRFYTPIQTQARTATRNCRIGDYEIAAGDRVLLALSGANRDPAAFEDPETFLLDRFPNRHLAFGMGIHRCVGSHLARLMFEAMVSTVLHRMPDYVVDETRAQRYPDIGTILGWTTMPVTFSPGSVLDGELPAAKASPLTP